jgi:hypothetical protein
VFIIKSLIPYYVDPHIHMLQDTRNADFSLWAKKRDMKNVKTHEKQ